MLISTANESLSRDLMRSHTTSEGGREAQPRQKRGSAGRGAKERRKARRATEQLAAAVQLTAQLNEARHERREAWPEGQDTFSAERQEQKLAQLHADKRVQRREIYGAAPVLEGREFRRGMPGGRS